MKSIIFISGIFLLVPAYTFAGNSLKEVFSEVHRTSEGKLITIRTLENNFKTVDQANGIPFGVNHTDSLMEVANSLCDFRKQWNASENIIFCISK